MSQGNDFANYAASTGAGPTASEDVWFVAVASDDIKQMSLEQLDEAFRLGIISAQTPVWTEGMEAWAPLGEVADLGDDDDEAGGESSEISSGVVAAPAVTSANMGSFPTHSPSTHSASPFQSLFGGPSSVAPVTSSYAPSPFMQSTVPVALNVDEDMPPIRVGRRFRPERWLLAAAAVVGLGVAAYNNSDLLASSPAPVAAAASDTKALATRPYDVGGGVEKGAALPTESDEDSAPAKAEPAGDAPIGAASALSAKEAVTKEAPEKETESTPAATTPAAPSKESLKGNFTKAFNKKAPAAKPAKSAKVAKVAKPRKAAVRAAAKGKKSSTSKAASAFDPLNDSLP